MTRAPARAHSRAAVLAPKALIALADTQTTAHGCADAAARAVVDARAHGAVVTAPVRLAQANGHAVVDGRAGQIRRLGYCSAIPAEPAAAAVVQRDAAIIEGHERRCQRRQGGGSSEHHQKNRERKSSPHCGRALAASSGKRGLFRWRQHGVALGVVKSGQKNIPSNPILVKKRARTATAPARGPARRGRSVR